MKQMCKKKYPSPVHAVTNFLTLVASLCLSLPRLHTTIRQLRLESSIRHVLGLWILIILRLNMLMTSSAYVSVDMNYLGSTFDAMTLHGIQHQPVEAATT